MAYVANHTTAVSKGFGLSGFFSNAAERFSQYRVYRNTVNELNCLSDRELSDLGLNRSMIRRIALEACGKV